MQQPGRKSAAALSVVSGVIDGRPKAPDDLNEKQAEVWERTVANEAADTFKTAALQQLLKEYCRHVSSALKLSTMVEAMEALPTMGPDDLKDYDKLLAMRDRETKAITSTATKLRLTNQSRYQPSTAAVAAKRAGSEMKPWQMTA